MSKIRILLADDHAVLRSGLRMLLNAYDDMEVIGEAESGEEAVEKVLALFPDLVIMDISMPGMGGILAVNKIKAVSDAAILMLTMHADEEYVKQVLQAGVGGYVLKQSADTELIQAIRQVAGGQIYIDPEMAQSMVKAMYHQAKPPKVQSQLTDREKEVLGLIALGHSNKEIAEILTVSVKTVESHKTRIMEKIQCQKRSEMVRYAIDNGYI